MLVARALECRSQLVSGRKNLVGFNFRLEIVASLAVSGASDFRCAKSVVFAVKFSFNSEAA